MTIPLEEVRAIDAARDFLRDLLHPKTTPRIPKDIRRRAQRILRHYPWPHRARDVYSRAGEIVEVPHN